MRAAARLAAALPVVSPPGLPEMRLHLAGPRSGLGALCAELGREAPPYWAHVWGGGFALARFLLDRPAHVRGRRVLDAGTGCGVAAIAAALGGAAHVSARDVDPLAVEAARLNADLNGVALDASCGDAFEGRPDVDLVLAGDVFYEPALAVRAGARLALWARAGVNALIGDPGRRDFSKALFAGVRLAELARIQGADFGGGARLGVFTLTPD